MSKFFSIFSKLFVLSLLTLSQKSFAQCACTPSGSFPTTINGITISLSNSGSVSNYGANWPSCGLSAGPLWVGQSGPFSQTFTFSSPVNNVSYVITAASGGVEAFTFSAGTGVTSTSQCGSTCPFSQVGNTFTGLGNDDGTTVIVTSSSNYTSMTVTGSGGSNGSLAGICIQSFSSCVTPTLTVSPSSAVCLGASKTLTVSGSTAYTWSPAGSLSSSTGSVVTATPGSTTTYTVLSGSGSCTATAVTTVSVSPNPTVTINPVSSNICAGSSATLTASGATNYTWSPAGTLNSANGSNVIATPAATTNYTVIGQTGICTNSAVTTVSISTVPTLTMNPVISNICIGGSTTLTATGATNYTWSPAGTLSSVNGSSVIATPITSTTYSVIGQTGICSNTATATVNIVTNPTVSITPLLTTICAGSSATLTASGATNYTWSPAGTLSSANGSNVIATPATTTTYSVIGQSGICSNSATATVSVVAMPTLTVAPLSTTLCTGSSATLTASGAVTYTWSPAISLNTSNGNSVIASPVANTIYTISGSVGPCTSTTSASVFINAIPNLTVTPNLTGICSGSSTTLTVSGASTYTWSPAGTLSSANGSSVTASPLATTDYTVTGTSGICTNTITANVIVNPMPVITVSPQTATLCAGSSVTLTAGGSTVYSWSPSSTLSSSTSSIVTATPAASIFYTLTGGVGSCTATAQATITVNANPSLTLSPVSAICQGVTATLTAAGATTYNWNPTATLNPSSGASVAATPLNTTTYSVTGTVGTCTSIATIVLNVISNPTISVVATTTLCAGSSSIVTASGAASYTWSPATGLNTTNGNVVTASPANTTVYTITGSLNTCTAIASTTVSVIANPVIVTGIQSDVCSGTAGNLSSSGATTYQWMPAATVASPTSASTTALPQTTTVYTVTGTTAGCSSTALMTISVTPTPTLNVTALPATICEGTSSTLSASGATSYTWFPAATLSSTNTAVTIANPLVSSTYTVIGANGTCTTPEVVILTVIPKVIAVIEKPAQLCLGTSTILEASGGTTYKWLPVTYLSQPNKASTTVKPTETTTYTVTVSSGNLCPATATVEVIVNPLPIIDAGKDTTINIDEFVVLNGTGNVDVGFLSPDGVPLKCNFCNSITVNPPETTCYTLRGENSFGCLAYDVVCVTITKDYNIYIPNTFTPNEDGNNDVFIPVGYGITDITLTIFDRWGTQIFKSNDTTVGWNGKNRGQLCEQGVYIYQAEVKTMAGTIVTKTGHVTLLPRIK